MKELTILVSGLILVLILGGTVWAQEIPELKQDEEVLPSDLEISEPKILPDNPFYFLKDLARAIRLAFVSNVAKKAELRLKFANEKICEAKKLAELKKDPKLIEKTLDSFEKDIAEISELSGEELKKFSQKLLHQQVLHQRILQRLENQVPEEVLQRIKEKRMEHLGRFAKIIQKIEEKERIADKIEEILEKTKGSEFKDFKNLEVLEEIREVVPPDVREKIKEKEAKIQERLSQKLEKMSEEEKERLKGYLEKIGGNVKKQIEIISGLQSQEISEKLRNLMEEIKEKKIEKIAKEEISSEKAKEMIEKAEEEIQKAEFEVDKISEKEYGGTAARKLLEVAKKHLDEARGAFEEKVYGRAFGLAVAAYHEALNAQRVVEKIETIKKTPEEMRRKMEKLYPGIEIPENVECKIPTKPECGEGEVWRVGKDERGCPVFICEKVKERKGKPEACPMLWDPVCGKDGKTYSNECMARMAGVEIEQRGMCKEKIQKEKFPSPRF